MLERITAILSEKFEEKEFSECFLVDIYSLSNKVEVFVESDKGITLGQCQKISRFLEAFLDESSEISSDYTVEVSSPGVDRPLKKRRQFPIHIGRKIEVVMNSGEETNGLLKEANKNGIVIERTVIIKEKKKKRKMIDMMELNYADMKEAKVLATI